MMMVMKKGNVWLYIHVQQVYLVCMKLSCA